jgi:hypothetical protein
MFGSSIRWVLSLNWLSQKWGQVHNNTFQDLAWVQWIKTSFEGTNILYHGGDIYLADVTFKNCTFTFGNDAASQTLLRKLQESLGLSP